MISEKEAINIAHECAKGSVIRQKITTMGNPNCPKAWKFVIWHQNEDRDTFQSFIEVTNNGIISDFQTRHISEESQ